MAKKKKKKPKKARSLRTIPETANPVRFFIFLTIGLILFLLFFFYLVLRGGLGIEL